MRHVCRLGLIFGALAGIALWGPVGAVQGGPLTATNIKVFDDGVPVAVITAVSGGAAGGWTVDFTGAASAHFKIIMGQGFSSQPNSGGTGTLDISSLAVRNISKGRHTLTIELSDIGFTASGSAVILSSSASGAFANSKAGDTATFQSWADASNTLFGMPGTTTGVQTATSAGGLTSAAVFTPATPTTVVPISGPFSLTNEFNVTLSPNASVSLDGVTSVAPVPEPATFLLLAGGLPLLGACCWRRKKLV